MQSRITRRTTTLGTCRHDATRPIPQIGRAIEAIRKAAGLTQLEVVLLLRDVGVGVETSVSTLQRWEATGSIKLDDAVRLAVVLGVPLDDFARPVTDAIRAGRGADRAGATAPVERVAPGDAVDAMGEAQEAERQRRRGEARRPRRAGSRRTEP